MLKKIARNIMLWFLCKINQPIYSPSMNTLYHEKVCIYCGKIHGKKENFKFLKALLTFIQMYQYGFFFSDNTHVYDKDSGRWGFYRFNHRDQAAMFDIDFSFGPTGTSYFHVHGDDYRATFQAKDKKIEVIETKTTKMKITRSK